MRTLKVELGNRSYPIYIGSGIRSRAELLHRHISGSQVMFITNEVVAPLYLQEICDGLNGFDVRSCILPDGEEFKTIDRISEITSALLQARFDRSCTLVALGGGVTGDIAGFAAATYQRGVDYIQIPTTLLAQVDSAVGGKTAVNHPLGKNMIGAFHQPRCVIADTGALASLPDREFRAGMAEVVKYGLIRDPDFFEWLEANIRAVLAREEDALAHAIERSCAAKAEIVATDEVETGCRALLNFGHTFAHAFETGLGYGQWLHGEAVAAGIALAAELSMRQGWLSAAEQRRIIALLERADLPTKAPGSLSLEPILELMSVDKKIRQGQLRLVVLQKIGRARVSADYDMNTLQATIEACRDVPAVA